MSTTTGSTGSTLLSLTRIDRDRQDQFGVGPSAPHDEASGLVVQEHRVIVVEHHGDVLFRLRHPRSDDRQLGLQLQSSLAAAANTTAPGSSRILMPHLPHGSRSRAVASDPRHTGGAALERLELFVPGYGSYPQPSPDCSIHSEPGADAGVQGRLIRHTEGAAVQPCNHRPIDRFYAINRIRPVENLLLEVLRRERQVGADMGHLVYICPPPLTAGSANVPGSGGRCVGSASRSHGSPR